MNKKQALDNNSEFLAEIKKHHEDFLKLIHDRLGIVLHKHQLTNLYKVITEACEKFNCTPSQYLNLLISSPDESSMIDYLISGITIGETYFFRDKKQMEYLEKTLLPHFIQEKRQQNNLSLRIWSAGCASGEEIYTIAIMLHELLPDIHKWNLTLLGTDINSIALRKAMLAHYGEWSMRGLSDQYKHKYFLKEKNNYVLSKKIKDLVKFDYLNLNSDQYPSIFNNTNSQDLILCRNVLIYFDGDIISQLMRKLSESLHPGGHLILGASDPIDIKNTNLAFVPGRNLVFMHSTFAKEKKSDIIKTEPSKVSVVPKKDKLLKYTDKSKVPLPSVNQTKPKVFDLDVIAKLLNEGEWSEVIKIINNNVPNMKSTFLLNAKATALANLGRLPESLQVLQQSLVIDSTDKHTYFLYALSLIELNKLHEAEQALRNALFLDYQFVVGHYQLGLLLIRLKQKNAGLKCLRNALTIAKSKLPDLLVADANGLTYGRLTEILNCELNLHSTAGTNNHEQSEATQET